jgi:hypothetical protein
VTFGEKQNNVGWWVSFPYLVAIMALLAMGKHQWLLFLESSQTQKNI